MTRGSQKLISAGSVSLVLLLGLTACTGPAGDLQLKNPLKKVATFDWSTSTFGPLKEFEARLPEEVLSNARRSILAQPVRFTGHKLESTEHCAVDVQYAFSEDGLELLTLPLGLRGDAIIKTSIEVALYDSASPSVGELVEYWGLSESDEGSFDAVVHALEKYDDEAPVETKERKVRDLYLSGGDYSGTSIKTWSIDEFVTRYESSMLDLEDRAEKYETLDPGANLTVRLADTHYSPSGYDEYTDYLQEGYAPLPVSELNPAKPAASVYYSKDLKTLTFVQPCSTDAFDYGPNMPFAVESVSSTPEFLLTGEATSLSMSVMKSGEVSLGDVKVDGWTTDTNGDWIQN